MKLAELQTIAREKVDSVNAEYNLARAQVEATLALAYEQRTANLIALWSNPQAQSLNQDSTWSVGSEALGQLLQQITERLDLS